MSGGWTVADVAQATRGDVVGALGRGHATDAGRTVTGAALDSRRVTKGQAFVALPGAHADGHAFVADALGRGAATALCARREESAVTERCLAAVPKLSPGTPLVFVDDPETALRAWARARRDGWAGELIGLTGSNGKTTTKEMLAAILARRAKTTKTEGNLNNHLGVPVTLTRLEDDARYAVVEIGMNHAGEVRALAALARPTAAVITSLAPEHLEGLGTLADAARAEAEIGETLSPGAPLVVPGDEPLLVDAVRALPARRITFALTKGSDCVAERIEHRGEEGMAFDIFGFPRLSVPVPGRPGVSNALAAIAMARALGLTPEECRDGLAAMTPPPGRMQVERWGNVIVLLDHYNANPGSMAAALDTLRAWPGAGRRFAALGDMLELGPTAPQFHAELGPALARLDGAYLWGPLMQEALDAAMREGGAERVRRFDDRHALGQELARAVRAGDVVLVKGSRGSAMEEAAAELRRALEARAVAAGEGR